jgi:predicted nucleic acid-binding protein
VTVVDASVAIKWLLPEPGSDEAQSLLDSGENLAGPGLITVEVAAALTRKSRLKEISPQDADAALGLWLQSLADGLVEIIRDEEDLRGAFRIAMALNHRLQDCVYLALSERLQARLVTADAQFERKARHVYPEIRLLGA